ncbi:hypothetical protein NEOLI_004436 [Neolecta irregularis DAH-3]|uniref:VPS37 C-terminal domain-containing protein n=1 Tax=Neolecta irregularis (strain DAH-3) TaxID=1198029 RepID=A0A1U7LM72_NEOID|nr:hypothetical protein NEOLI_004436 [Neolecta irregularis DAH-3]|eukprot:OLL23611.1 hypothetical protein NEOLI_004436 [Neolecta irregularis DAH-3]
MTSLTDTIPDAIPSLSKEDLHHLLDNTDLIDAILHQTNTTIQNLKKSLYDISDANIAAADKILSREVELQELRDSLEVKLAKTHDCEQNWKVAQRNMFAAMKPFSTPALYGQLQEVLAESEMLSDSLLMSFLDAGDPVDLARFSKDYRAIRKTYHLRKERLARWQEGRVGDLR